MLTLESTAKVRPLLENQKIEKEKASKRGDRQTKIKQSGEDTHMHMHTHKHITIPKQRRVL